MNWLTLLLLLGMVLLAYLVGSIPVGILLTRLFSDKDIRRLGSGNVGATNVRRVAGNQLGAAVLLGDVLKGATPVYLAMRLYPMFESFFHWELFVSLAAFFAFAGHLYPAYFMGRSGGKGVATAIGCFLMISPVACGLALAVFFLTLWRRRMVSLASICFAAALPVFTSFRTHSVIFSGLATLIFIFILFRHAANIRRIRQGTEPRIRKD
jgi:acyl phosphate:glycerol-3-phosphate acyltransferase